MIRKNILRSKSDTKYHLDKTSLDVTNYNLFLLKKDIDCDYKIKSLKPKYQVKDVKKATIKRLHTCNTKLSEESKNLN